MKKNLLLFLMIGVCIALQAQSVSFVYNGTTYNHKDTMSVPVRIGSPYVVDGISFHNNTGNNMNVIASCNAVSANSISVLGASNGITSRTDYYTAPFTLGANSDYSTCSFDLNVPSSLSIGSEGLFYFLVSDASIGTPDSSSGSYVFVRFVVVPDVGYVHFFENFENTTYTGSSYFYNLPTGWTSLSDNNANYQDYTSWGKGWCVVNYNDTYGKLAGSVSYLNSSSARADRWLITPKISIPYNGLYLTFIALGYSDSYPESFKVKISTTTKDKNAFTNEMLSVTAVPAGENSYMVDLSSFVGDSIYIGFVNCGSNGYYICIDDIKISMPNANEIALNSISLPSFAATNASVQVKGTVTNNGISNLNSYEVYYVVNGTDTSATYTVSGINVPYGSSHNFTHNVPFSPVIGNNTVDVYVANPNDVRDNESDNSLSTTFNGYDPSSTTPRKVLMENFTTAQCPNCPSAHTRIANAIAGRNDIIWLAHHVGYGTDAMTLSASNQLLRFYGGDGTYAPALMLDRTKFEGPAFGDDPGPIFFPDNNVGDAISTAAEIPAYVKVTFPQISYDQSTRSLSVTVAGEFTNDVTLASPRVSVYLIEDSIMKAQQGATGLFKHDHVIRAAITNILGDASVITSTTAGSTFEHTYTYTLPASYKDNYCRVIAFVSTYSSSDINACQVANSNISNFLSNGIVEGIGDIDNNISMRIYPNPVSDYIHIETDNDIQEVSIVNTLGQTVYKHMGNISTINTQDLASGLYILTVKSLNGIASRHINIVK